MSPAFWHTDPIRGTPTHPSSYCDTHLAVALRKACWCILSPNDEHHRSRNPKLWFSNQKTPFKEKLPLKPTASIHLPAQT